MEYEYSTLEPANSIRLLVLSPGEGHEALCCRLTHALLSNQLQYEALSYAWNDPSKTCEVVCEGEILKVTESLHAALRHLRHETAERTLWADAICINQNDLEERSRQVRLMGEIYAQSQQALIWIGEDLEDLSNSFSIVQELHMILTETEKSYPYEELQFDNISELCLPVFLKLACTDTTWSDCYFKLFRQPWFVRRWVVQEVAKAPSATLICGNKTLPWDILANVHWCLIKNNVLSYVRDPDDENLEAIMSMAILLVIRQNSLKNTNAPILESIVGTRLLQCTDPRDVVYSLLGVVSDVAAYGNSLIPDYDLSVTEVFKRFAAGCITQKGSLYPLSVLYVPPKTAALNLPTWVADFSRLEKTNPLIHLTVGSGLPFHASGNSALRARVSDDGNLLYAWGRAVDVVTKTGTLLEELPGLDRDGLSHNEKIHMILAHRRDFVFGQSTDDEISEEEFEAFWRTILCNLTAGYDRPPPEYGAYFRQYSEWIRQPEQLDPKVESKQELMNNLLKIETALFSCLDGWRLCTTKNGHLGQVIKSVEVGDIICILDGGELPYAIRRQDNGRYKFIASCYVHGLMDGEGCVTEVLEEEFCFC